MSYELQAKEILNKAGIKINGKNPWDIKVNNSRIYQRVFSQGTLGLGESYMDGDWDCKKLDEFFYKVTKAELSKNIKINPERVFRYLAAAIFNPQSKLKSRKVAEEHYNLGNDLYEVMLDKNMQYTCGYWKNAKTLDQAQEAKLKLVAEKLKLKPGMTVLELGGGFGGLARYLAKNYKVKVEVYNISKEQIEYGKKICKGLNVVFHEKDYREATGQFDRVASIGMMEHVGPTNYRTFMKVIHRCLKDNGIAIVHTIGKNVGTNITTGDPWIMTYIFPGGHLPSVSQITGASEGLFVVEDVHNFGPDYDKTLMAWYNNTNKGWNKLKDKYSPMQQGHFKRMWDYYLLCCAGAFRSRTIQLWQTVLTKKVEERYDTHR